MKIALISPYDYLSLGGVTKHISALCDCFRRLGHKVKIITACSSREGDMPDHVLKVSGFIASVPFSGSVARISLAPSIYRRVKRLLRQEQFDVIHVHEPMIPALPLAVLCHCKVVPRAVIVGTFHAYRESSAGYKYGRLVFGRFIQCLDGRIAVSKASRDYVAQYFPGDYVIIPNGIDVAQFSDPSLAPIERFNDGKLNILFVGRLEKRKGVRHLLAAFAHVKKAVPKARLIVAGAYEKADRKALVLYARRHRLRDVRFIGVVSEEDLPRYYRTCDVFCAPSIGFESFGLVLLEAMAAGRSIVASDIAGYRTVVRDGEEGLLVPPGDEEALATGLISLLRDPALRQRMGERGQARAYAYSWDKVAQRILDFYGELLEKKGRGIALC
jgi:phosphatidylinositol alpha-mannosyltransferase